MRRNRGSDIGEGVTASNRTSDDGGSEKQHRHLLTCVISSAPCRVATMTGGNNDEIVGAHHRMDGGYSRIEFFQRRGVSCRITTMAMDRVEVDEVCKQEAAVAQPSNSFQRQV